MKKIINFLFINILICSTMFSQVEGDIDESFGTNGYMEQEASVTNIKSNGSLLQENGKLIVFGTEEIINDFGQSQGYHFLVMRFNSDGSRDVSFGNNGEVSGRIGSYDTKLIEKGAQLQSDGKILIAGKYKEGDYEKFFICRYNSTGTLDENFGSNGFSTLGNVENKFNRPASIDVTDDGKIYLAANIYNSDNYINFYDNRILRFNTDGSIDTEYGNNGHASIPELSNMFMTAIIDSKLNFDDELFVLLRYSVRDNEYIYRSAIVKYLPTGSLDQDFGTNGVKDLRGNPASGVADYPNVLEITGNGNLVVLSSYISSIAEIRIQEILKDGSQVKRSRIFSLNTGSSYPYDLSVLNNGSFYITASATDDEESKLIRLDYAFDYDYSFGQNGIVSIPNLPDHNLPLLPYIQVANKGDIYLTGDFSLNGYPDWSYVLITKIYAEKGPTNSLARVKIGDKAISIDKFNTNSEYYNIEIPVQIDLEQDTVYAFEIVISGFNGTIDFSDIADYLFWLGWKFEYKYEGYKLTIAGAGPSPIIGNTRNGNLFGMNLKIDKHASIGFHELVLDKAVLNQGNELTERVNGGVLINEIFYGDVDTNGVVQAYDASQIMRYLLDDIYLSTEQLQNADVTNNSEITSFDATKILQYIVGTIQTLPDTNGSHAEGSVSISNPKLLGENLYEIPFGINNFEKVFSFETDIKYNPEIFEIEEILFDEQLSKAMKSSIIMAERGIVKIVAADSYQIKAKDTIFKLRLKVKSEIENVEYKIILSSYRLNENIKLTDTDSIDITEIVTGVKNQELPTQFNLSQNYPNPFNPTTKISFTIPDGVSSDNNVSLKVFDVLGNEIVTLVNENKPAGNYEVNFDSKDFGLSSGIYFYRINSSNFTSTRKMILLK
ncbi:MAG: T9SS type A sorting domain-containing protein [Melioribacteraceae bacterium]|nr:T9SS type A sorting domain-containing protein [Melioribacteraceae bacterium]